MVLVLVLVSVWVVVVVEVVVVVVVSVVFVLVVVVMIVVDRICGCDFVCTLLVAVGRRFNVVCLTKLLQYPTSAAAVLVASGLASGTRLRVEYVSKIKDMLY